MEPDHEGNSGGPMGGPPSGKKPYQAPSLRVYGSLAKITETVNLKGNKDGGMFLFLYLRTGG